MEPQVQRVVGADRVLAVLTVLASHPDGIALDELARIVDSAKPTVHRALATLRRAGFAEQEPGGRYRLGNEFLRLAFLHHEARPDNMRVQPVLAELSKRYGETVHYAVLDGRTVVYQAKIDPPTGAMRLTSVVGGRNPAHSTGVGKLLLSYALGDEQAIRDWLGEGELERRTERTITTVEALHAELERIRKQGYAVDDQENETGVNCLAVPVFLKSPTVPSGAISVSALSHRTPLARLVDELANIRRIVQGDPGAKQHNSKE